MNNNNLVLDVDQNPNKIIHWVLFAIQHILAMFVACITVPLLTGLPIPAATIVASIGKPVKSGTVIQATNIAKIC